MTLDLAFTPSGRLVPAPGTSEKPTGLAGQIAQALASNQAAGLFALAAARPAPTWAPSCTYWRAFAGRYMTALCQHPEGVAASLDAIPPPEADDLAALLRNLPPMAGAEYVGVTALADLWRELDAWVRAEVESVGLGLAEFLKARAPLWHQVGRVCFHLAENRRDADHPFAFLATYAPTVAAAGRVRYQPLSRALQESADERDRKAMVKLLAPVHEASKRSRLVGKLVESGDLYHALAWSPRQAHQFLLDVPILEECGILVRLPDWWKKRGRPTVTVTIGDKRQVRLGAESMLDFKVELALGDQQLSEGEWRQLLAGDDGLVLLRGQWVELDRGKLAEALEQWRAIERQSEDGVSFIDGMRLLAGAPRDLGADAEPADRAWSFVEAGKWLGQVLAELRDPARLEAVRLGRDLRATLRPYQHAGVQWLWLTTGLGLGACLADDMGLGKTIQVLALLLLLRKRQRDAVSLLVLPASLLANWQAEIDRFAPSLRTRFLHPSQSTKEELARMAADPERALRGADVVLTTYGMLLRQSWLLDVDWRLAVLDEAQAIKNPAARQTKAAKRLKAAARIALTGTPVENRLSDLWSLFDFLAPGLLGSQAKFKQFAKSLEQREQDRYAPLRGLVQPYILRRMKTDKRIIADLPDKTEVRVHCGLMKRQAALYARLVQELANVLEGVGGMQRRGLVLAYLLRFKQVCNHPSQLLGDGDFAAGDSGKFARLADLCDEIASRQEKALVFTQFREMTGPLAALLAGPFGRAGLVLHGGTPVRQRKTLVDAFQRDDGPPFFVLSLKAGGTGLNLTAASHVVHFDRWWNPAVENQATDRAFRIGQHRNVLVHKFVCQGTVEDRIDAMIEEKTELARDLLEGGAEKMLTELSDAELIDLVSLDIDKASV